MPPTSQAIRRARVPAYLIAGLMLLIPLIEIAVSAWPYRMHDPNWRMGIISLSAGASTGILLALLIAYLIGVFAEDRLTSWFVAIASAVMVLFCLVGSGGFVLDALQVRGQVQPGFETRYNLTSGWALGKMCLAALGAAVLSVNALRNALAARRTSDRRGVKAPAVLVSSSTPVASGPTQ